MFEPLDALYSAMYGTMQGYNVPSDITTYWNGSQRYFFVSTYGIAVLLGGLASHWPLRGSD